MRVYWRHLQCMSERQWVTSRWLCTERWPVIRLNEKARLDVSVCNLIFVFDFYTDTVSLLIFQYQKPTQLHSDNFCFICLSHMLTGLWLWRLAPFRERFISLWRNPYGFSLLVHNYAVYQSINQVYYFSSTLQARLWRSQGSRWPWVSFGELVGRWLANVTAYPACADAQFVGAFEAADKVYFLLREIAIEQINCAKVQTSLKYAHVM